MKRSLGVLSTRTIGGQGDLCDPISAELRQEIETLSWIEPGNRVVPPNETLLSTFFTSSASSLPWKTFVCLLILKRAVSFFFFFKFVDLKFAQRAIDDRCSWNELLDICPPPIFFCFVQNDTRDRYTGKVHRFLQQPVLFGEHVHKRCCSTDIYRGYFQRDENTWKVTAGFVPVAFTCILSPLECAVYVEQSASDWSGCFSSSGNDYAEKRELLSKLRLSLSPRSNFFVND